ncbi:hypothetical protein SeMB42_g02596 [Synchytrium endobioticum]|uniref:THO complex subunit 5 n=1 Tax=Synchytrium endobioticum TaxID=286115 RepID=A0A507DCT3_9FUNG|nr:hypothetical protein SeMB42_g02596 [Synchytrium endobioticum]TPX50624.1 hypothetical protein SeLEV6574_g00791 [Synchytrium endobioticum]
MSANNHRNTEHRATRHRLPSALHAQDDCEKLYTLVPSIVSDLLLPHPTTSTSTTTTIPLKRKIDASLDIMLDLEQINREAHLQTRHTKHNTTNVRQNLNAVLLQLQNLQYQQLYLQREIAECEDLETVYQDISLISDDEFQASAPPEFSNAETPHDHMINRFKHEIFLRKKLLSEEKALVATKEQMRKQNLKKKEDLARLDDDVSAIIKASKLLQMKLGTVITETREKYDKSVLLSKPLFALFNHVIGYATAFEDTVSVDLTGDLEAAKLWHINGHGDKGPPLSTGKDERTDDTTKSNELSDEDKKTLYTRHPLEVVLSVRELTSANNDSVSSRNPHFIHLTFAYLVHLGIVVVFEEVSQASGLSNTPYAHMCHLFPDDSGLESPNPANAFLSPAFEFDPILASGRAFKWAQPLCGLDFPNSVVKANSRWYADSTNETDFIMKPYFSKLCELLRKRYRALRSLGSQFQNLIGYKPKLMVDSPNPNHVVKVNQIIDKSDGRYSRQAANVLPNSNVIKDLAMVLDVPGFTVNVEILVHLGYPDVVPTFTFVHDGKNLMGVDADTVAQHYKEIERAVCQQPRELVKRFSTTASGINPAMLLTYQVIKSVACTDIFMTAVRAGDDETLDAALPDYETAI